MQDTPAIVIGIQP